MNNVIHGEFPYGGDDDPNSGFAAGSPSSEDRARSEDSGGITSRRQQVTVKALDQVARHGLTWRDLASRYGWHHGQASGTLSVLHKTGKVRRLTERRNRCAVYVLPEYQYGRLIEPPGQSANTVMLAQAVDLLRDLVLVDDRCRHHSYYPEHGCNSCVAADLVRRHDNRKGT